METVDSSIIAERIPTQHGRMDIIDLSIVTEQIPTQHARMEVIHLSNIVEPIPPQHVSLETITLIYILHASERTIVSKTLSSAYTGNFCDEKNNSPNFTSFPPKLQTQL